MPEGERPPVGTFIEVVSWSKVQHYGDKRSPPWIKLYNDWLDKYEFAMLPDAQKAHLMLIWCLASRNNNLLPADPVWLGRQIQALENVELAPLVRDEELWLRYVDKDRKPVDINGKALRQQDASTLREEVREEKRREEKRPASILLAVDAIEDFCKTVGVPWDLSTPPVDWIEDRIMTDHRMTGVSLGAEIGACSDWHESNRKKVKSASRAIRNWLRKAADMAEERRSDDDDEPYDPDALQASLV